MAEWKQPDSSSTSFPLKTVTTDAEKIHIDKWNHIDLRGRVMRHPPWKTASSNRKNLSLLQPPETLQEIVNTFLSKGGSAEQLCSLLNHHMISPVYNFKIEDLKKNRFYSLEFYFYLFTFCKILLDDPEFHYKKDDSQLNIHHYILEKGKLNFPPWKIDDSIKDGYLSIANIRAVFVFVENVFTFDNEESGRMTGEELAKEVLTLMNRYVEEPYRVDRAFFNKEEVLVSFEYLFTITSIFELLMNTPDLIGKAYRFGTLNNHHLAQAVFLLAGKSPSDKMKEWVQRTNNVYDFIFSEKKQSLEIQVDATRVADSGMFGLYEANCFRGIRQAFPAIFSAFMEIAKGKKNRVKLNSAKSRPYQFSVWVSWGPDLFFYLKMTGTLLIITACSILLQKVWDGYIPPILFTFIIAAAIGIIGLLFQKYRSLQKTRKQTAALISTQLNSLQTLTRELMVERDSLNETVQSRTRELQAAVDQLQSLDRSKTNFIANISHELRTPLSLITVPLEGIQKGLYGEQISCNDNVFKLISRNTKRLQRQIKQLLDFAKLDLGEHQLQVRPVDLLQYCEKLLIELNSLAAAKGLTLEIEKTTGLNEIYIDADITLLETLMLNLLGNGIKFTSNGNIKILIEPDKSKGFIQLSVKDTGIGFSEKEKMHLFDRFYQAEENHNRTYEGTGLGLALVKEITDLHKWEIRAQGNPGNGACFTLSIPLSTQTITPQENQSDISQEVKQLEAELIPQTDKNNKSGSNLGRKILIIDDNPDMASILEDILIEDFSVEWSSGGNEAIESLLSNKGYSLVICDMMMPGMSGLELRREYLKNKPEEDIPFIFLTALADKQIKQQALEAGGVDYIIKPFSSEELKLKIQNLVETNINQYRTAVRDIQGAERLIRFNQLESLKRNDRLMDSYNITRGEKRIIDLLKQGLQDKEIAEAAGISPRTVSTHLRNLYKKTDTQNRVELLGRLFMQ